MPQLSYIRLSEAFALVDHPTLGWGVRELGTVYNVEHYHDINAFRWTRLQAYRAYLFLSGKLISTRVSTIRVEAEVGAQKVLGFAAHPFSSLREVASLPV